MTVLNIRFGLDKIRTDVSGFAYLDLNEHFIDAVTSVFLVDYTANSINFTYYQNTGFLYLHIRPQDVRDITNHIYPNIYILVEHISVVTEKKLRKEEFRKKIYENLC